MMIYVVILVSLAACLLYYIYQGKYRRSQFEEHVTLSAQYRIQDHAGQYSGNLKSRYGSLIFNASRRDEQLRAVVIRKVKIYHRGVSVKLNQSAIIPFVENKDQGLAISVRFRITSDRQSVDLSGCQVMLSGVLNLKGGDRVPFKMSLPIENVYQHEEEVHIQQLDLPIFH
ncbi:hypothetical protein [Sphingobacterium faecium]|uniref:hypothetical protein n=1 Tax=Sphingobacterium faecium TaxID=34087 RepID=UPI00320AFFE9